VRKSHRLTPSRWSRRIQHVRTSLYGDSLPARMRDLCFQQDLQIFSGKRLSIRLAYRICIK